jgi:hypothetical protein
LLLPSGSNVILLLAVTRSTTPWIPSYALCHIKEESGIGSLIKWVIKGNDSDPISGSHGIAAIGG